MSAPVRHRITYEIVADGRYTATCLCGLRRESGSTDLLSAWGPAHVVKAFEKSRAR
jgi:hypothetical protein